MAVTAPIHLSDTDYFDTILDLAERWNLRDRESRKLLSAPERTFYHWKAGRPHLSADQRDRISHLANIELALNGIFNDQPMARDWIRRPNEAFEERAPLDVMMQDGFVGILRVRNYLQRLQ
jgi:putative toxin-antitoxin system antitoxin component (TIGR02293 family)